ncbi:MAG: carboxypeptidase regulatory-like domain-containing protein, partial [Chitinophagaceae bacterium]
MRKFLAACLMLIAIEAIAQPQHGPVTTSVTGSGTGLVFGQLIDASGQGVTGASVAILKMKFDTSSQTFKGSLLKGTITKSNGQFSLEDIPFNDPFQLKISAIGYKPYTQFISLKPADVLKDMGKLSLTEDSKQLEELKIRAVQPLLRADIDKLSFQVEKNMITAGGTALDVMRHVPSVQVDIDGNIKLRNAVPQLFVDGRPTNLTLEQIPADAIESVEIITNPSAKYDASSGGAGILNLVLKKNRKTGYNANLRFGIDKRGAVNGGADL